MLSVFFALALSAPAASPHREVVTFSYDGNVGFGNGVFVVGNHLDLGSWDAVLAVKLRPDPKVSWPRSRSSAENTGRYNASLDACRRWYPALPLRQRTLEGGLSAPLSGERALLTFGTHRSCPRSAVNRATSR